MPHQIPEWLKDFKAINLKGTLLGGEPPEGRNTGGARISERRSKGQRCDWKRRRLYPGDWT